MLHAQVKLLEQQLEALKNENFQLMQKGKESDQNFGQQISSDTAVFQKGKNSPHDAISTLRVTPNGELEFLVLSKHCKRLFELEEHENTPAQVFKKIFPEDLEVLLELIAKASKTLEFVTLEMRIATKSNPEKWLKLILKPEYNKAGDLIFNSLL